MELATSESPERPAGVPEGGSWNASIGKWEAVPHTGAGGAREGECLRFRADGTLFSRSRFVADVEDGPFTMYHSNGAVWREGRYVAGRVEGLVSLHASPDGSGEPLQRCCVPPGATRLDLQFRAGELLLEVFYDREGRALLSDGKLRPACPDTVPALVAFDESRGVWALRSPTHDRLWTVDGRLFEEEDRLPGGGRVTRLYDEAGAVSEERGVDAEGRRTGPFHRRLAPEAASPYADPRIREERGAFEAGQAVGVWTFLDHAGAVVRTIDRGVAASPTLAERSPAFAPELADGWTLARELVAEHRVREALCAAARAAVRATTPEPDERARLLLHFVRAHVVALAPALELEQGEALTQVADVDVAGALDALVCGAEAAFAFRALSAVLPGSSPAVVELVEASLLLAPGRSSTHITRALVRAQRGDEAGARADTRVIEADAPAAAASLVSYLDLVFRPFELPALWAELVADPDLDGGPAVVEQGLEAISNLVAIYATRLFRLREAILAFGVGSPPWLPPDLSDLLPDGPVELRRETVPCDPNPDGGEPETIEIDERLALDGMHVAGLLAIAHADHAALAWLCWSTGRARIELPRAIEPPGTLIAGMRTIVQRHWRANDRAKTGGLVALGKGIPGFEWRGFAVDEMPPHVLSVVLDELLSVRSMLLWLLSPDAMSPFQDDIRDA